MGENVSEICLQLIYKICCRCCKVKVLSSFWVDTNKCKFCFPADAPKRDRAHKICDNCGLKKKKTCFESRKFICLTCRQGLTIGLCFLCKKHDIEEAEKFCSGCWEWLHQHRTKKCQWCFEQQDRFLDFKEYGIGDDTVCWICIKEGKKVDKEETVYHYDICCIINNSCAVCPECGLTNRFYNVEEKVDGIFCIICDEPSETTYCKSCKKQLDMITKLCQKCKRHHRETDFKDFKCDTECIGCLYLHLEFPSFPCKYCGLWIEEKKTMPTDPYKCRTCKLDDRKQKGQKKCQICNTWFDFGVGFVCSTHA